MHLIEVNLLRTLEVQRTQFAYGELLDFEAEGVCRGWETWSPLAPTYEDRR